VIKGEAVSLVGDVRRFSTGERIVFLAFSNIAPTISRVRRRL
jgi:hypothetical protein